MQQYDLTKILSVSGEDIVELFMDRYTACVKQFDDDFRIEIAKGYYEQIFEMFTHPFGKEEIEEIFKQLTAFKIEHDVPYVIVSNELYGFESTLLSNVTKKTSSDTILEIIDLFRSIRNMIAKRYLHRYTQKLITQNAMRRHSLGEIVEKNCIRYYEEHLLWLSSLAQHVQDERQEGFPELDFCCCVFGKWLQSDAKNIIHNNSKFQVIELMHRNLHLFAKKIYNILPQQEHHVLMTYLEKCELISLGIGTELALIDQIDINKKIAKDSLTQALNRNALERVFESQYELSLAINNSFVIAMCDLDHFKTINDTYGHVAGDEVLRHFVAQVKKYTRNADVVIRYGGEEFVIILPAIDAQKGYAVLDNVRQMCEADVVLFEGQEIHYTVSMGMSEIKPKNYFHLEMVIQYIAEVDKKLYIAKEEGRNRIYL